jgi:hypothetical protein
MITQTRLIITLYVHCLSRDMRNYCTLYDAVVQPSYEYYLQEVGISQFAAPQQKQLAIPYIWNL